MKRIFTFAAVAMAASALTLMAAAQPTTPDGISDPGPPAVMPPSPPTPRARRDAPDPTAAHVAHHEELTAITQAAEIANRLEHARRVAPIDLRFGMP